MSTNSFTTHYKAYLLTHFINIHFLLTKTSVWTSILVVKKVTHSALVSIKFWETNSVLVYLAFFIRHYGFKIYPHCYNTDNHSSSLLYSIMFSEYARIYFSISTVNKHLNCFHFLPIMNNIAVNILMHVSQNTVCTNPLAYLSENQVCISSTWLDNGKNYLPKRLYNL